MQFRNQITTEKREECGRRVAGAGVTHGRAEGGAHGEAAAVEAAPEAATEALPKRSSTN